MTSWKEAHRNSEDLAITAHQLARAGRKSEALEKFREAADAEEDALKLVDAARPRTLGITGLSAASLRYKAGDLDKAEALANQLLEQLSPSSPFARALRELLQTIWYDRQKAAPNVEAVRHSNLDGVRPAEILLIDTVESRDFFARLGVSSVEKADCQTLLLDAFSTSCQNAGGILGSWAGDGGFALFSAERDSGNAIRAARNFISNIPWLNQQTKRALGDRVSPDDAQRRFRIAAHFGLVNFNAQQTATSSSSQLDDFIKYERHWAPVSDELFITEQLRDQLQGPQKEIFERFRNRETHGTLTSALYRMPLGGLTSAEQRHLVRHIYSQKLNIAARDSITVGLIEQAANGSIGRDELSSLTIRTLYNYLTVDRKPHRFQLTLWRRLLDPATNLTIGLERAMSYPSTSVAARTVSLDQSQYQVVRAFLTGSPIATPSVNAARLQGDWADFDLTDGRVDMLSSLQVPIYRVRPQVGGFSQRDMRGILSIDSDKPDLFVEQEVGFWLDELTGFLANLALAEHLP